MPHIVSIPLFQKILAGLSLWCGLFLIPTVVHSATTNSATLQWAANSESDLAGYKVYQGTTAGSYGPSIDVGNITTHTASNLQTGLTYYFAITAYDLSGNESYPSAEVSKYIADSSSLVKTSTGTAFPTFPASIVLPAPGSTLTSTSVTFTGGHTSQDVSHWLYVGSSSGAFDYYHGPLDVNHAVTVSGLPTSGTVYVTYFSQDSSGWQAKNHTYTLSVGGDTTSLDITPPSISLTSPADGSTLSGTVNINATATDNIGVIGVQFQLNGTNLGPENTTNPFSIAWDTTGVAPGPYTLTAIARDAAGNTTSSAPITVRIPSPLSTLSVAIAGNGSVTSSPAGIRCTNDTCTASYGSGSTITLIAQADKRWKFAGWSGACSGTGECVVQLTTNQFVGATFSQNGKGRNN